MRHFVEHSIGIVTALVPSIGYEQATSVAKEALETGRGVYDVVLARGLMTREQLDEALDPELMIGKREGGSGKRGDEVRGTGDGIPS
jgi:aspartate ammonia-lyase